VNEVLIGVILLVTLVPEAVVWRWVGPGSSVWVCLGAALGFLVAAGGLFVMLQILGAPVFAWIIAVLYVLTAMVLLILPILRWLGSSSPPTKRKHD
jgi:hypothetical protein